MTTQAHIKGPRHYGEPAGVRLLVALQRSGADLFPVAQAVREGARLGLTPTHTMTLLHRLTMGGWVTRVKKGLYATNDLVTQKPRAHPFPIGTALVNPSAVSHWSALHYWGLVDQPPPTVTLSSSKRTFPPSKFLQGAGSNHSAWVAAGVRYEVIGITEPRFFGVSQVCIDESYQIPIFGRERSILDAFHHFHVFGSLSVGLEILEQHLNDINALRLVQFAQQLGVTAVVKRLGWALDRLDASPDILAPLEDYPAKGETPLDPGRPARGHHNPVWRVIENL